MKNSLANILNNNNVGSLYVDDFLVCFQGMKATIIDEPVYQRRADSTRKERKKMCKRKTTIQKTYTYN
jgi:hypothetical protein